VLAADETHIFPLNYKAKYISTVGLHERRCDLYGFIESV